MNTMLYNDPHPVHKKMAEHVGLSLVEAEKGPVWKRALSAMTSKYNGTVVLEGGAPLIEGAGLKKLRNADKVIMLGADETLINQARGLSYYNIAETKAHEAALRSVDGVIAVSPEIAQVARRKFNLPTQIARPFVVNELALELKGNRPALDGDRILFVAENRDAFDQEMVKRAAGDHEVVFVGKGTESLESGRGYVSRDELIRLYKTSDLFVMSAEAGAYPMAPIESMMAGVPAIVTRTVGTAEAVAKVDDAFVVPRNRPHLAHAIEQYFKAEPVERMEAGRRASNISSYFMEKHQLDVFTEAYNILA